jgi:hypothetical protein
MFLLNILALPEGRGSAQDEQICGWGKGQNATINNLIHRRCA